MSKEAELKYLQAKVSALKDELGLGRKKALRIAALENERDHLRQALREMRDWESVAAQQAMDIVLLRGELSAYRVAKNQENIKC